MRGGNGDVPVVDERVAIEALWGGVRLVVIDTETTVPPGGGPLRAVSVAAVTCRLGTVRGKWQTLVNPGIPVDRVSRRVHGITDEHLVGEPIFADVANLLLPLLTPNESEQLVLVAHNVGFDVSVLRHELQLLGQDLPDIPVIDTMGGLASFVGVRPPAKSLSSLIEMLGIANNRPHDALADAVACADAVVNLLNRAAAAGHTDFEQLLAEVSSGATTHSVRASRRAPDETSAWAPVLPPAHTEGHASVLSRRAGSRMLAAWSAQIAECAQLRCRKLDARVSEGQAPAEDRLRVIDDVLHGCVTSGDIAGAATVLGATLPLLADLPPRAGRLGFREAALAWAKKWQQPLNALGRCDGKDLCPACRRREACPLDMWPDAVAAVALGDPSRYARGFFETTGREAGRGGYTTWLARRVDQRVADAAVWLCVEHWRSIGQESRSQQVVTLSWAVGCRHPDVADAYAGQLAAPGRLSDLQAGIAVCDDAFSCRGGSTHEGWSRLTSRRNQLAGRAQRLTLRPSGAYDEDGNPIPLRRHHPAMPRRARTPRFVGS